MTRSEKQSERQSESEPAELTTARRYTAVTLWAVVLSAGLTQLLGGALTAVTSGSMNETRGWVLLGLSAVGMVLAACAVPVLLRGLESVSPRHPIVVSLTAVAIATWLLAVFPTFAGWSWGFGVALAAGVLSCVVPRGARVAMILAGYAFLALGWGIGFFIEATPWGLRGEDLGILLVLLLTPIAIFFGAWSYDVVLRLDGARRVADELAVARERLRFATDLHDIQGHHLQVIALKSELAERLLRAELERDTVLHVTAPRATPGVTAAAGELEAIREISRTALEDTRALVNNYRAVDLGVETRNAAQILRSAGIACTVTGSADDVPTAAGNVLAHVIREGTTNILRHSGATRAAVRITREDDGGGLVSVLTLTNNGATVATASGSDSGLELAPGTGLLGLAERLHAVAGTLEHLLDGDTFVLSARVPDAQPGGRKEPLR